MKPGTARSWGDGAHRTSEHLIGDISFTGGWAICQIDGARVEASGRLSLEDAWDIHRHKASLVTERMLAPEVAERANDAEVSAFLTLAADPSYEFEAME